LLAAAYIIILTKIYLFVKIIFYIYLHINAAHHYKKEQYHPTSMGRPLGESDTGEVMASQRIVVVSLFSSPLLSVGNILTSLSSFTVRSEARQRRTEKP